MTVVKARDLKKDESSVVFSFRDIATEANDMLEAARAECKRIVENAKKETEKNREIIFKEAHAKGYESGQKKGYEDAYAPAEKKGYDTGHAKALQDIKQRFEMHINEPLQDTKAIIEYFETNKKQLLWQAEQSFVVLAVKLAEKVIRREIELQPELVKDTVRMALETVSKTTNVVIRVSPQDISIIEDLKSSLSDLLGRFTSVSITPDESVSRGGCIVQSERGRVDARIETQIDRIARDILEPGACLDIEEENESLPVDKLIRETSELEDLNPVIPAVDHFEPEEVIPTTETVIDTPQPAAEPADLLPSEDIVSEPVEESLESPADQAESLRQKMKENQDPQDLS